ncbi:5-carboxymethyl-2-hydroxymuconate Delta-isomerase [Brevundimonas sp.]|uniref:5-carboxymethyl-2-hydroxymuconate Delta-isomerase n=1 Tax=Brevundimonas sp. TaxID=1871086 RepID=UPI002FC9D992
MPQITLEHSTHFDTADYRALALEIHQLCVTHVGATIQACKTRIVRVENLIIADGAPEQAMVHCDLRILSGRTQEQKTALVEAVQQALLKHLTQYDGPRQISVEIGNLDKPNYRKVSLG